MLKYNSIKKRLEREKDESRKNFTKNKYKL